TWTSSTPNRARRSRPSTTSARVPRPCSRNTPTCSSPSSCSRSSSTSALSLRRRKRTSTTAAASTSSTPSADHVRLRAAPGGSPRRAPPRAARAAGLQPLPGLHAALPEPDRADPALGAGLQDLQPELAAVLGGRGLAARAGVLPPDLRRLADRGTGQRGVRPAGGLGAGALQLP